MNGFLLKKIWRSRATKRGLAALCAFLLVGVSFGQDKKDKKESPFLAISKAFKLSGYTQFQYVGWKTGIDSFSVRRSRLTLGGDILKNMRYKIQVDLAKTPTLLDAIVDYEFSKAVQLRVGQFLLPFSLESLTSVADMDMINRSQAVEKLSPGRDNSSQGRDAGVAFFGNHSIMEYSGGIFNGAGINKADTDSHKDVCGRIVFHPSSSLWLGGSFYLGKWGVLAGQPLIKRDKAGLEMVFNFSRASIKAEYLFAKDDTISRNGWYVQGGYDILPKKVQALFKFDTFDINHNASGNRMDRYTAGINWFISGKTKLQVNYEIYRSESGRANNQAFLAQFQVAY